MRKVTFLLLLSFIFIKCSSNSGVPSSMLQPDDMKVIIFDLLRADELINMRSADTSFKKNDEVQKYYEEVFLLHKTDRKTFYNSYKFYQSHPDVNKVLFDSLNSFAARKRIALDLKKK